MTFIQNVIYSTKSATDYTTLSYPAETGTVVRKLITKVILNRAGVSNMHVYIANCYEHCEKQRNTSFTNLNIPLLNNKIYLVHTNIVHKLSLSLTLNE